MSLSKNRAEELIKGFAGELKGEIVQVDSLFLAINTDDKLACISETTNRLMESLQAEQEQVVDGVHCKLCVLTNMNAELVRRNVRWAAPSAAGQAPTQTVSTDCDVKQLEALIKQGIKPMFVPNADVEKNYRGFLDKITWWTVQNGYKKGYSADAGVLKTEEEVVGALVLGYSQLKLDCGSKVNEEIANLSSEEVAQKYAALPEDFRSKLESSYLDQKFKAADGSKIKFEMPELKRIALTYVEVIVYARYVHNTYLNNTPWPVDFVVALQGSKTVLTAPAEFLILNELERLGARTKAIMK